MVHEYFNDCALSWHSTSAFARSAATAWWTAIAMQKAANRAAALADGFRTVFAVAIMRSARNFACGEVYAGNPGWNRTRTLGGGAPVGLAGAHPYSPISAP